MQRKIIAPEEYKNIKPDEELIFSDHSLVNSITLPPKTIFNALHGNLKARGAQGTLYIFREDDDLLPFNVDEYSFNSDKGGKIDVIGPLKPEYHWAPDIPEHLKGQAPKWAMNAVRQTIDRTKLPPMHNSKG